MKYIVKSFMGLLAAVVFAGSVTADTIRPVRDFDDDWEERVLRFTPSQYDERTE